jgi:sugar/nucleoside kinase (ribokinase family)
MILASGLMMASKETEILCIGNALVDVFANAEVSFAEAAGLTQPVQHIEMERLNKILPQLNKTVVSGGGAANTAKIAGLLGAKVSFTGALGADCFGRVFEKELKQAGVELRLFMKPSPTGVCLYLKNGAGETRIAASPSAAHELSSGDISEDDIRKARVVVIDGFMMDRPGLVSRIFALARLNKTTAALDLSSEAIARKHAAEVLEFAKHEIILFMNEAESAAAA